MKDCIADVLIKMNRDSALPDAYLHQPEAGNRRWMNKHGRKRLALYDNETEKQIRKYFNQLTSEGTEKVGAAEVEELLVSFGLVQSREEVEDLLYEMDFDGSGDLDFNEFVALLKGVPARYETGRRNYLSGHNIMYDR